jgi:hypothetical protein
LENTDKYAQQLQQQNQNEEYKEVEVVHEVGGRGGVEMEAEVTMLKTKLERKEQENRQLIAGLRRREEELEMLRAETERAKEEVHDSEEQFARLAVDYDKQKRELNACMATLLDATRQGFFKGLMDIETLGAVYDLDVFDACLPDRKALSWTKCLKIFEEVGDLLIDACLEAFRRENGNIVGANREIIKTALERKEYIAEVREAKKMSDASMENLVDLFVWKRRELEERCPSGLYGHDVLWDREKKCGL